MTQVDLAVRSGVSLATVREFEAGFRPHRSPRALPAIARALGVPEDDLR
jgi:transcriptional regulator with XRE-family HTH domain